MFAGGGWEHSAGSCFDPRWSSRRMRKAPVPPGRGSACTQPLAPGRRSGLATMRYVVWCSQCIHEIWLDFLIQAAISSAGGWCFNQALLHQPQQIDQLTWDKCRDGLFQNWVLDQKDSSSASPIPSSVSPVIQTGADLIFCCSLSSLAQYAHRCF